jgi:pentapeptide repeat protein
MRVEQTPAEPSLPSSLELVPSTPIAEPETTLLAMELRDACWSGAQLDAFRVEETLLARIDLSNAALTDAVFVDAVLDEPDFSNAVIRGGSWTRVLVSGGRLTGTQLAETLLRDTTWRGVSAALSAFRMADLGRTTFQSCNLREADFTGSRCEVVRFHDCDVRGAVFTKARFASSEFRRCELDGIEGVESLSGTSMEYDAAVGLAPALAAALGIRLVDG